jgi:hypothetical protein
MILALGDEAGIEFSGRVEEFTEEGGLMNSQEFKSNADCAWAR